MRINEVTVLTGKRGTGKTTFIRKVMLVNQKKTLIVDTLDHPAYRDIPIIPIDKLKYWKSGTYRVVLKNYTSDLVKIGAYSNNCNIIYEDAKKYFVSNIPAAVMGVIIDSKQKNVDVFIMYHSLSQIPKYLREMYDNLIIFKTKDSKSVFKRFANSEEIEKVHSRVINNKSKYYCERIKE